MRKLSNFSHDNHFDFDLKLESEEIKTEGLIKQVGKLAVNSVKTNIKVAKFSKKMIDKAAEFLGKNLGLFKQHLKKVFVEKSKEFGAYLEKSMYSFMKYEERFKAVAAKADSTIEKSKAINPNDIAKNPFKVRRYNLVDRARMKDLTDLVMNFDGVNEYVINSYGHEPSKALEIIRHLKPDNIEDSYNRLKQDNDTALDNFTNYENNISIQGFKNTKISPKDRLTLSILTKGKTTDIRNSTEVGIVRKAINTLCDPVATTRALQGYKEDNGNILRFIILGEEKEVEVNNVSSFQDLRDYYYDPTKGILATMSTLGKLNITDFLKDNAKAIKASRAMKERKEVIETVGKAATGLEGMIKDIQRKAMEAEKNQGKEGTQPPGGNPQEAEKERKTAETKRPSNPQSTAVAVKSNNSSNSFSFTNSDNKGTTANSPKSPAGKTMKPAENQHTESDAFSFIGFNDIKIEVEFMNKPEEGNKEGQAGNKTPGNNADGNTNTMKPEAIRAIEQLTALAQELNRTITIYDQISSVSVNLYNYINNAFLGTCYALVPQAEDAVDIVEKLPKLGGNVNMNDYSPDAPKKDGGK